MGTQRYTGGCHCGGVRFEVQGDLSDAIECNCSICTKKGFIHLIVAQDAFTLIQGAEALTTYTFGTHVAKHTFCGRCGMHPFYTPRSHPEGYSVNIRCLDGIDLTTLSPRPFDGSHWEQSFDQIR